jgi:tetratricopeptide (TPR) repeat protein
MKTYENMAETYDLNKQYEKAAECCQKIIDIDPHFKNDEIYFYQGEYLQMGKMYSEAKKAYLVYL